LVVRKQLESGAGRVQSRSDLRIREPRGRVRSLPNSRYYTVSAAPTAPPASPAAGWIQISRKAPSHFAVCHTVERDAARETKIWQLILLCIAPWGNERSCFTRLKHSSCAAATIRAPPHCRDKTPIYQGSARVSE